MLLQARKQAQRLKAVNFQRLEEIVVGREFLARDFELRRGQVQDLIEGALLNSHSFSTSGQVGLRVSALHKFFQPSFDRGLREQLAKYIDLALQLIIRDRLDEFLGCG